MSGIYPTSLKAGRHSLTTLPAEHSTLYLSTPIQTLPLLIRFLTSIQTQILAEMKQRELQIAGGFSDNDWALFIEDLRKNLRHEGNRIGLEGSRLHGLVWDGWLEALMDGGLGDYYWGPESDMKWKFPEDKDKIRPWLKRVVQRASSYVRDAMRIESKKHRDEETNHSVQVEDSAGAEKAIVLAAPKSPRNQQKRRHGILSRSSTYMVTPTKPLDQITPPSAKRARISIDFGEMETSSDSSIIDLRSNRANTAGAKTVTPGPSERQLDFGHDDSSVKPLENAASPVVQKELDLTHDGIVIGSIQDPNASAVQQLFGRSHGTSIIKYTKGSPAKQHFDPHHDGFPRRTPAEKSTGDQISHAVQQDFEYALEASISGSSNSVLIHGADVPTIARFIEVFRAKHKLMLDPEDKIRWIVVARLTSHMKLIHIDLSDERDWGHILKILRSDSLRVEVAVTRARAS